MAIPGSNYLELTRGNSLLIDITPIDEETSQPIILENDDRVLFTIYNETRNTKLQKTLTKDDYTDPQDTSLNCLIEPEDTVTWLPGNYPYDCLLYKNSEIVTFISSFIHITEAYGDYTDLG
jgi:hypothetical protein